MQSQYFCNADEDSLLNKDHDLKLLLDKKLGDLQLLIELSGVLKKLQDLTIIEKQRNFEPRSFSRFHSENEENVLSDVSQNLKNSLKVGISRSDYKIYQLAESMMSEDAALKSDSLCKADVTSKIINELKFFETMKAQKKLVK